jgi:poly-gamma-glutamate synthesis protein (capsule biosynthesis protein)
MLGRGVADRLAGDRPQALFHPEVAETARRADLFLLNLECCISERGSPWPDAVKPFFFRAPPAGVEALVHLGVDCVSLANNHALDFGTEALLDTLKYLSEAGIACVGAGPDREQARAAVVVDADGLRLAVLGVADHPRDFAAGSDRPGISFDDLRDGIPEWLRRSIGEVEAEAILVTPHWGPNMNAEPVPHVRRGARDLVEAGSTLVAGHSAHVFQGVQGPVLFDMGDFLDDYAVDAVLRNDLGLLFLVTLGQNGPIRLEALPLRLEYCFTRPATGDDAAWIGRRFREACAAMGTEVSEEDGRLVVSWG